MKVPNKSKEVRVQKHVFYCYTTDFNLESGRNATKNDFKVCTLHNTFGVQCNFW